MIKRGLAVLLRDFKIDLDGAKAVKSLTVDFDICQINITYDRMIEMLPALVKRLGVIEIEVGEDGQDDKIASIRKNERSKIKRRYKGYW